MLTDKLAESMLMDTAQLQVEREVVPCLPQTQGLRCDRRWAVAQVEL
jgi:hypothetical protein